MYLRRRCILLPLDGMSWRYQWDPSHLMYPLRLVFLINFLFWYLSTGVSGVLKSPTIIVLLSISPFMFISVLCFEMLLYWVHRFLQLLCLPLGFIPWSLCNVFLISCDILYFKVYFIWYENCYYSFLLLPICMECIFSIFSLPVYMCFLGLKWVSCRQYICGSYFCIHSASLCLLVGAFNPFTFKVITDTYVPIAIFLILEGLIL